MRQIIAITLAVLSLLSNSEAWVMQGCRAAESATKPIQGRCACCKDLPVCDCDKAPDHMPGQAPIPTRTRHATALVLGAVCPVLQIDPPQVAATVGSVNQAQHVPPYHGPHVPVFILHCSPLC